MDASFKEEWYDTAEKLPESAKKLPCLPLGEILGMFRHPAHRLLQLGRGGR